jgi:hypothetical protein
MILISKGGVNIKYALKKLHANEFKLIIFVFNTIKWHNPMENCKASMKRHHFNDSDEDLYKGR